MGKEKYVGVKFKTVFVGSFKPTVLEKKLIKRLIAAGKIYGQLGLVDQNGGNISVRVKNGLIIKKTGSYPYQLKPADFVLVTKVSGDKVFVKGDFEPSSEVRFHWAIYKARPDINCVLHAHDFDAVNCKEKCAEVGYIPHFAYGTLALAKAVFQKAKKYDYIIEAEHGVIALGKDVKTALNLIKKYYVRFKKLAKKAA
ncbi:MAG: class II aldolase/adducin family protein [Candidatus Buchananbacteria bacterium]